MRPGWTGGLFLSRIFHPSLVILIFHFEGVALSKNKSDAPIAGNLHGPAAFLPGLKEVKPGPREIHILEFPGLIQAVKNFFQLPGVFGLDPFLGPFIKKSSSPLWAKD